MLNVDDPDDAVRELRRAAKVGSAGAMIALRPVEHRYDHPKYEPLWAAAQDLDRPLSLHMGTYRWQPGMDPNAMRQDVVEFSNREHDVRTPSAAMIFAGVFERYPKIRVRAVEFEVCWAQYFLSRMDNPYTERAVGEQRERFKEGMLPSDFFHCNVFIGFQEDDLGVQLRAVIGVENLMWGSDYPHAESTFPRSREMVARILKNIPDAEMARIAMRATGGCIRVRATEESLPC